MDWKEFLKPTKENIILFIVLFGVSFYITTIFLAVSGGASNFGYPFQFFQPKGCYGPLGTEIHHCWETKITSYIGLIGDIVIWYLVSCLIILGYKKIRKKQ